MDLILSERSVKHLKELVKAAYDKGLIQTSDVKLCLDMVLESEIRLDERLCNIILNMYNCPQK